MSSTLTTLTIYPVNICHLEPRMEEHVWLGVVRPLGQPIPAHGQVAHEAGNQSVPDGHAGGLTGQLHRFIIRIIKIIYHLFYEGYTN